MRIRRIHDWNILPSEAIEIQKKLRRKVSLKDTFNLKKIRFIAGADVSYEKEKLYGAVVVISFPDLDLVEEKWIRQPITFPYVPGLLTFREAPVLLKVFSLLKRKPDAVTFDGQGIAHPRGFGLAAHMGFCLNVPSLGCAKTRLVGEHRSVGKRRGSFARLNFEGKLVGTVVRTRTDVKPVYVSPGHRISFRMATRLVLVSCRGYRLPEPIRLAHRCASRIRGEESREILESKRGSHFGQR